MAHNRFLLQQNDNKSLNDYEKDRKQRNYWYVRTGMEPRSMQI